MEKQAQEIGQFLYKRGREGKRRGGGRMEENKRGEIATDKKKKDAQRDFTVTV